MATSQSLRERSFIQTREMKVFHCSSFSSSILSPTLGAGRGVGVSVTATCQLPRHGEEKGWTWNQS